MAGPEKLFAYAGKILRINLSDGRISTEPTAKYARDWIGASGIAIKILYDELKSWITPFDPANKLIFGSGPLVGTTTPGANKMNVSTLGPVINGWASSCSDSYVGGQLKYSGFDSVVIEGKAHTRSTFGFMMAGRDPGRPPSLGEDNLGNIGDDPQRAGGSVPARGFHRPGWRAPGSGSLHNPGYLPCLRPLRNRGRDGLEEFEGHCRQGDGCDPRRPPEGVHVKLWPASRELFKTAKSVPNLHKYGNLSIFPRKQEVCGIPYKNFQETRIPDDMAEVMHPFKTLDKFRIGPVAFPGCAVGGCGRRLHITEGPYAGLKTECNQWEVLGTLQARLAVWEPTFMIKVNALCNQLGLDVDFAGGAIGWAMECYQRGILTEKDTDGLKLNWGDAGVALESSARWVLPRRLRRHSGRRMRPGRGYYRPGEWRTTPCTSRARTSMSLYGGRTPGLWGRLRPRAGEATRRERRSAKRFPTWIS